MDSAVTTARIYNFSPGPAVLPLPVLEQAQRELLALPGCGASILEISHRSPAFIEILAQTKSRLTQLLGIPAGYQILFLQGGSRLLFSMIPMNLLRGRAVGAEYLLTGSWGQYACTEARREGPVHVPWDGRETNYDRLPAEDQPLAVDPAAAYLHFTSNETIQGVQFRSEPLCGEVPLVCDASSDFLSRPLDVSRYGLIYACAQKNAGPAGVTIVIVRDDLLERSQDELPGYLNFRSHAEQDSLYNTPPTFAIYLVNLVARWLLEDLGGLDQVALRNERKAALLYAELDASEGFYRGHAQPECRSRMNVTFRLPSAELESRFVAEAAAQDLGELKGHRSVGGIRASIYNAMPLEGVEALRQFMRDFRARHAG
ncbi:MAG: 3-phosphoserine/phosphohydroxythreonine transaminase [Pirellulaceae bacterium]|nr:3-phosphoserine/phosphohydroxythreonine transaminase [Pirellulaceae bacterium]